MIEVECPDCGKALQIDPIYRGQSGRCNHCGGPIIVPRDALTAAQKSALANTSSAQAPQSDDDWKTDPATPKQLSYLADLGATPSMMRGLTKGKASEMIEDLQEIRDLAEEDDEYAPPTPRSKKHPQASRDKETARAIRKQTDFQKNACGCLIILLTAPIWIPILLAIMASQ